jgi:hypothetical protein
MATSVSEPMTFKRLCASAMHKVSVIQTMAAGLSLDGIKFSYMTQMVIALKFTNQTYFEYFRKKTIQGAIA